MPTVLDDPEELQKIHDASAILYAEFCDTAQILPRFHAKFSSNAGPELTLNALHVAFLLADAGMCDEELLALLFPLNSRTIRRPISILDLSHNGLLTDRSLAAVIEKLSSTNIVKLESLKLTGCTGLTDLGLHLLFSDAMPKFSKLRELHLAGLNINPRTMLKLASVLADNISLRDLNLADTGLNGAIATRVIKGIFANGALQKLDLGWNPFDRENFAALGWECSEHLGLKSLGLANTSSTESGQPTFVEAKSQGRGTDLRGDLRGGQVLAPLVDSSRFIRSCASSRTTVPIPVGLA